MERRWDHSGGRVTDPLDGQIRVALKTNQPDFLPDQHPWIRRAVRFMARPAAFKPNCGMLKGERAAFVSVAVQAPRLVRPEALRHSRPKAAVRIVAIDAGHRGFWNLVMRRSLELHPDVRVATRALLVNRRSFARDQSQRSVCMNLVAGRAGHFVLRVAVLNPANMRRLIQVTSQASLVGRDRRQFTGILNRIR